VAGWGRRQATAWAAPAGSVCAGSVCAG
jgi:hypothetical protein